MTASRLEMRHADSVVAHIYQRKVNFISRNALRFISSPPGYFKRKAHFKRSRNFATLLRKGTQIMTNNIIVDLSMDFSIAVVNICDSIKGKAAIVNQLLRSGTSIGANIHEANYASSRADFIAKMQIALKECYETEYWLELFVKTNIITEEQYKTLKNSCGKIRKLLISSINTAKANS